MGGRVTRWLAGLALGGAVGCSTTKSGEVHTPDMSKPVTALNSPPPGKIAQASPADTKPVMAETIVALAELKADAARDQNRGKRESEALQDQARVAYQKALEREPKNKPALIGLGRLYQQMNDREKMVETFSRATAAYPNDGEVWYEYGVSLARLKDWDGATDAFKSASRVDPENRQYRKWVGLSLARAGHDEEAFEVLCKTMPEAEARYSMAKMYEHMGKADSCRRQLDLSIDSDPNYEPARQYRQELAAAAAPPAQSPPDQGVRQAGYRAE